MDCGDIRRVFFEPGKTRVELFARTNNPCHIEPCDVDGDGNVDFVVADLGSFEPADHDRGRIMWLKRFPGSPAMGQVELQLGLGRVSDVQPADIDGDGDIDLSVAEFGWRKTGRVLWFEQKEPTAGMRRFQMHVLDERHGSIHAPVADLNGDGRLDIVALISQEHETVMAYLNAGDGTFEMQQIFGAGDPSYGSTGIQVVDIDGDGDLDVLYTNGDTFDSQILKPDHYVHWLENRGGFPFVDRVVSVMPGAYRALCADLDNDGDQDIIAVATTGEIESEYNPLIWFEQQSDHSFTRHDFEHSAAQH
jgi:hypothetical protein